MGIIGKTDPRKEDEKIRDAKEFCETFKKNPVGALVLPAICIAVIAYTAAPVWSHLFVDYRLFFQGTQAFLITSLHLPWL